jgi:hypothetical protein
VLINVEEIIGRITALETALPLADQINGQLTRENKAFASRILALESEMRLLRTRQQEATLVNDHLQAMLKRKYELDVEAGVAKELSDRKASEANRAALAVESDPMYESWRGTDSVSR